MARGPLLLGLLLLLLCSPVCRATSSHKEAVDHGVDLCPQGQYVNGSCKMDLNGTDMDQPNNETDLKCGINMHWDRDSHRCVCNVGYFQGGDCTEFCDLRTRCENRESPEPGTMVSDSHDRGTREPPESMTSQHSESTLWTSSTPTLSTPTSSPPPTNDTGSSGSTENGLPEWLICVIAFLVIFAVYLCYKCRDQLRVRWTPCISYFQRISYFGDRTQHQGQVHDVSGLDPRNSVEMQTVPVVAVNGQYNPEETHSLLSGGNSDSAPDCAISVVPEVMPQSGSPETPPPAQVTLEQEPGCTSVASSL